MSSALFEQYKAALRKGHLALLGGALAEAADAYREAARLVPDRALPHAGLGTALYRMGRVAEGDDAFEAALRIAPGDEATLAARTTTRRELGLDGPPATVPAVAPPDEAGATAEAVDWPAIDLPSPAPEEPSPDLDPDVLLAEAADRLADGDAAGARDRMLAAVAVHRAAGRPDAALDVCFQLLAVAPGDPGVHLAIAGLQLDRGWQSLAADKIALLLRLTSLTGDTQAAADAHALAAERLRDEPQSVTVST